MVVMVASQDTELVTNVQLALHQFIGTWNSHHKHMGDLRDLFKSLVLCVQKEQTGSVMYVASPTEWSLFTAPTPCSMQYDYGNCPCMWSILMELWQQAMVHSL